MKTEKKTYYAITSWLYLDWLITRFRKFLDLPHAVELMITDFQLSTNVIDNETFFKGLLYQIVCAMVWECQNDGETPNECVTDITGEDIYEKLLWVEKTEQTGNFGIKVKYKNVFRNGKYHFCEDYITSETELYALVKSLVLKDWSGEGI
jgi:hypothetical protein